MRIINVHFHSQSSLKVKAYMHRFIEWEILRFLINHGHGANLVYGTFMFKVASRNGVDRKAMKEFHMIIFFKQIVESNNFEKWPNAINENLKSMDDNEDWDLFELPKGFKSMDDNIGKYNVRLVTKDMSETSLCDAEERYHERMLNLWHATRSQLKYYGSKVVSRGL
ncbi:hypothetical protein CR513_15127, partial [Mucuna pruriens]